MMKYYEKNAQMHEMYVLNLIHGEDKPPLNYLYDRLFTIGTITTFRLGATVSNRIVFPICNAEGRIEGFQTRATNNDDDGKKYLNTENSEHFRKAEHLYGMEVAYEHVHKTKTVYLVEGNLDALRMHQCGYKNVLSIMGSKLSVEQARSLWNHFGTSTTIVLMFDGDAAGNMGMMDAIKPLIDVGFTDIRMVELPPNYDPDMYFKEHGWFYGLKEINAIDDFCKFTSCGYNLEKVEGRYRCMIDLLDTLRNYPDRQYVFDAIGKLL